MSELKNLINVKKFEDRIFTSQGTNYNLQGTTDGPGAFDFIQGSNNSNAFWDIVSSFLKD